MWSDLYTAPAIDLTIKGVPAALTKDMHHFLLPVVVDGPGSYITRGGETVTIDRISSHRGWGYNNRAEGRYADGTPECWSARGGRVLPYTPSRNDIVGKA